MATPAGSSATHGSDETVQADLDRYLGHLRFVDRFSAPVSVPWRRLLRISPAAAPDRGTLTLQEAGRWTRHLGGELSANRWRLSEIPGGVHSHQATVWDGARSLTARTETKHHPEDFSTSISSSVVIDESEMAGALSSWRGSLGLQYLNIPWSDWIGHYGGDHVTPLWREELRGEDCLVVLFDQAGLVAREAKDPGMRVPAVAWFDDRSSLLPARLVVLAPDAELEAAVVAERLTAARGGPLPFATRTLYDWHGVSRATSGASVRQRCVVEHGSPIPLKYDRIGVGEEVRLAVDEFDRSQRIAYESAELGLSFPAYVIDQRSKARYYVESDWTRVEITDFDVGMMQALNAWPGRGSAAAPFQLERADYRGATCGPLALYFSATLLGSQDVALSDWVGALSPQSRANGTSTLLELKRMALDTGFEARAVACDLDDLEAFPGIAVCHLASAKEGLDHFAAVHIDDEAKMVHVASPPFLTQEMNLAEFREVWSGHALLLDVP